MYLATESYENEDCWKSFRLAGAVEHPVDSGTWTVPGDHVSDDCLLVMAEHCQWHMGIWLLHYLANGKTKSYRDKIYRLVVPLPGGSGSE